MKDYYRILGVSKDASQNDIDSAYRTLARKYHPDLNKEGDAVEKFKEVAEAYEILGDKDRRAEYDHPSSFGNMGDFFSQFFGGGQRRPQQVQLDLRYQLNVTFMEMAEGCTKEIELPVKKLCENCQAVGWLKSDVCNQCHGRGFVVQQNGIWSMQTDCRACRATGSVKTDKCPNCNEGFILEGQETIQVTVPKGVEHGSAMRMRGKGEYGRDGRRGDLHVFFFVEQHEYLHRNGLDLFCEFPASYTQLVLGGEVEIPGLKSKLSAKIPTGTSPGTKLMLKGQGLTNDRGRKGNFYVVLRSFIPKDLPEEYIVKLKELALLEEAHPSKEVCEFNARMNI